MGFPVGHLKRVTHKHGKFGDYEVRGDWVVGADLSRGWYIVLDGLDQGSFAVVDGEVHPSGRHYLATPEGETVAPISPEVAELSVSAKQAILDAIAEWEKEERENQRT